MTRLQFIVVGLFISVLADMFVHMTHPAYKYYRKKWAELERLHDDFERRVEREFVPSILNLTNLVQRAALPVSAVAPSPDAKDGGSGGGGSAIPTITARYFTVARRPFFEYEGQNFTIGDDFFLGDVLGITPTSVITTRGAYLVRPPFKQQQREETKNDIRTNFQPR